MDRIAPSARLEAQIAELLTRGEGSLKKLSRVLGAHDVHSRFGTVAKLLSYRLTLRLSRAELLLKLVKPTGSFDPLAFVLGGRAHNILGRNFASQAVDEVVFVEDVLTGLLLLTKNVRHCPMFPGVRPPS